MHRGQIDVDVFALNAERDKIVTIDALGDTGALAPAGGGYHRNARSG
jgi:hypothetical protein